MSPAHFTSADELDRLLGDPSDPGTLFSYARCEQLDRLEEFPAEICRELDGLGLPCHYVPAEHGGALTRYDELMRIMRVVARRDLTVAIGHGKTFLGGACTWVAGTPQQAAALAADIAAGVAVAWGLTERAHGSDLLAGEMVAVRVNGGYRVDGEKWLINNATRGDIISLLVRTDPDGGPRGFSVLLFDKRTAGPGSYECLPKVPTHGIRGADISGIAVRGSDVPVRGLVGPIGTGIETVLMALQLTRTVCAALSLGAGDQAVSLAAEFTAGRLLYGRPLIELPHVRRTLGRACADLLTAEAVTTVAARAVQALPAEMSIVSAVTKAFVPARIDELITVCGELLGARAFLTDVHADGRFQKLERDHGVVAIFDGTTVVNQNLVINHAAALVRGYRAGRIDTAGLELATDLRRTLPAADLDALQLLASGGCSVVQGLSGVVREVRQAADTGRAPAALAEAADELLRRCDLLHDDLAMLRPTARDVPVGAFVLAARYEACFAGAAVLNLWLRNHSWARTGRSAALWDDALWVRAALASLLERCGPGETTADGELFDRLAESGLVGNAPVPLFPFDPVTESRSAEVTP